MRLRRVAVCEELPVESPLQTTARHYAEALAGIVKIAQHQDWSPEERLAKIIERASRARFHDPELPRDS